MRYFWEIIGSRSERSILHMTHFHPEKLPCSLHLHRCKLRLCTALGIEGHPFARKHKVLPCMTRTAVGVATKQHFVSWWSIWVWALTWCTGPTRMNYPCFLMDVNINTVKRVVDLSVRTIIRPVLATCAVPCSSVILILVWKKYGDDS